MRELDESEYCDPNPVISLGDLLRDQVSVAALATAIEKEGIYCYDRFGRFLTADCKATESWACDLGNMSVRFDMPTANTRTESFASQSSAR